MDYEKIEELLKKACEKLKAEDSYLLKNDLSERSIVFRFALYLSDEFKALKYNVDCEYNRLPVSKQGKFILSLANKLENLNQLSETERKKLFENPMSDNPLISKKVFPDIIVHERGNNERNLLIIECKKSSNPEVKDREYDKFKLGRYLKSDELKYLYGVFIEFIVGDNPDVKFERIEANEL